MVAVVKSGGKRRILNPGGNERWRGKWGWWKKANKLKSLCVRASGGDAVIFGDSLVECSRDIKEPSGAKLGGAGTLTFPNATGEEGNVFEESMKVFA